MNLQFILIYILHIFNDGSQAAFLLLLPFIAKDIHINLTQVGMLGTFLLAFETVFALPAGYMGAKFNGLKVLTIAMAVYGLGYITLPFISSFLFLLFPFLLVGVALAIFHPISFALVAHLSEKRTRGRQLGDYTAIGDLGRIAISTIAIFIAVKIGWRHTSFLYGLIIFLIFFVFSYLLHTNKKELISIKNELPDRIKITDILKNVRFLLACFTGFFDALASSSLFVFLPFLLIKKGIDPAILGSFTAAYFVGNFLGKSGLGRLVDQFGSVKTFILGEILMAMMIVLLAFTNAPLLIIIFSIILGALTKGTIPARVSMAVEAIEHHGRFEKAIGVSALIVSIGVAGGPILYGRIADLFGVESSFYAAALIALLATVPAAAFRLVKR